MTHVIDFREGGWTIRHPLSCRPNLFDCPVNRAAEDDLTEPPTTLGQYRCDVQDNALVIGDEATAHDLADEPVVEHAIQMSGGGMHVRNQDPEIERIFPLADWIVSHQRFGGKVYRRTVIVVEDWTEVPVTRESESA